MSETEALKARISKLDRKLTEQRQLIKRLRGQLLEAEATMRAAIRVSVHSDNLVRLYKSICDGLRKRTDNLKSMNIQANLDLIRAIKNLEECQRLRD